MTASVTADKPAATDATPSKATCPTRSDENSAATSKTWSFSISIGGANPLQIKGTITANDASPARTAH